jgi:ATP-dependent RNA helicase SUPV3L1/SUV3
VGFEDFPDSPPPGRVTVAAGRDAPAGDYPRAGYRLTGERAIRIDMLERRAVRIRPLVARAGFEAPPGGLSLPGLGLEPFARLMQGMGFQAAEGTRPKRRPEAVAAEPAAAEATSAGPDPDVPEPEVPVPDQPDVPFPQPPEEPPAPPGPDIPIEEPQEIPEMPEDQPPPEMPPPAPIPGIQPTMAAATPEEETEAFFVFTRGPRPRPERQDRPDGKRQARKPRQDQAGSKGKLRNGEDQRPPKPAREDKPVHARPPRQEKPVDPDNPFAALMALKLRS